MKSEIVAKTPDFLQVILAMQKHVIFCFIRAELYILGLSVNLSYKMQNSYFMSIFRHLNLVAWF